MAYDGEVFELETDTYQRCAKSKTDKREEAEEMRHSMINNYYSSELEQSQHRQIRSMSWRPFSITPISDYHISIK